MLNATEDRAILVDLWRDAIEATSDDAKRCTKRDLDLLDFADAIEREMERCGYELFEP